MKIAMVGAGYVGLVSGACLADFGHDVVCIDKDQAKIDSLLEGVMPIFEPGLAELVASNVKAGRLSFSTDLEARKPGSPISSMSDRKVSMRRATWRGRSTFPAGRPCSSYTPSMAKPTAPITRASGG